MTQSKLYSRFYSYMQPMVKGKKKHERRNIIQKITASQGREAFAGSLLRCESARQATKPPKPV